MSLRYPLSIGFGIFLALLPGFALAQSNGLHLLECIGDYCTVPVDNGPMGAFFGYFNVLYPWAVGMGAAIAVLMALVGGVQMITAGGDSGKFNAGKTRIMMSLGGLILVLFSSQILHIINPTFFQ